MKRIIVYNKGVRSFIVKPQDCPGGVVGPNTKTSLPEKTALNLLEGYPSEFMEVVREDDGKPEPEEAEGVAGESAPVKAVKAKVGKK